MITEDKKRLINRLHRLNRLIPDTIQALQHIPNIVNGSLYAFLDPGKLRINTDYNLEQYTKLRRTLSKQWKYKSHHFNEFTGSFYVYFEHRKLEVELTIELNISTDYENGVNCRLVEVDYKTTVIYGLECK